MNFQNRATLDNIYYTSAGVDMLEGNYGLVINNQGMGNVILPLDRVNFYTLPELENALDGAYSWNEWATQIFNEAPNNNTRQFIQELFDNW